jgi:hypothetical protein
MSLRRHFSLPPEDVEFLDSLGLRWELITDKVQWLLIHGHPLPTGYCLDTVSVAIRIEAGYPHAALDMVYFFPFIARSDSKPIPATEATQTLDGKEWQRWSRHRTPQNPWRSGEDNIESHFLLIEDWLRREFMK